MKHLILIKIITIEIIKFIVASESPINLKSTFLQFGIELFKDFNSSSLSVIFKLFPVHPENSSKILFSIPT